MRWCWFTQTVRLNVGGKLLTNYLKEILSYRQLNVMDEFDLVTNVSTLTLQM
jgi:hypothetical protein